jgi:ATP-dependent Clp protease ATP-binding subunit ClpA
MFERYTESSRRCLFFARHEVTQVGGLTIQPEHLVLGILRGAPHAVLRFARDGASAEALRAALTASITPAEKVSTSVEIPFDAAVKDALQGAAAEADEAKNKWIRPEHLVLGVLVKTYGDAARVLQDAGVDIAAIRDHLAIAQDPDDEPREAHVPRPGAVCRQWKGVVKPGKADEYLAHLRETLSVLVELEGFLSFGILRRDVEDGVEFQVSTIWRSVAAIEAFAGADVTRAVVPPAAQALLVRYDDRAVHYELVQ